MTVHYIFLAVEPPKGDAENAVQNCVENYSEWNGDVTHSYGLQESGEAEWGYEWLTGEWFFETEGDKPTDILQDLKDRLSGFQGGLAFRAFYAISDHDEDSPTPCEITYAAEYGDPPDYIRDIPESAKMI